MHSKKHWKNELNDTAEIFTNVNYMVSPSKRNDLNKLIIVPMSLQNNFGSASGLSKLKNETTEKTTWK